MGPFVDSKLFMTVFATVFLAELGDKTQIATLLYSANVENPKLVVFAASASALVLSSLLGVTAGSIVAGYLDTQLLSRLAGVGFIAVGLWTFIRA